MKYFLLPILGFSFSVFADCTVPMGQFTTVTIKEGKEKSLFQKGKPLESHKTLDQDGLGICYAMSTSVALKTVLPNNPDVSYLHIGLQTQKNNKDKFYDDKSKRFYVDGGDECETFNNLQMSGGACSKEQSPYENHIIDPREQEQVFAKLSKLFDQIASTKTRPEDLQLTKDQISYVILSLNSKKESLLDYCKKQAKEGFPYQEVLQDILSFKALEFTRNKTTCATELQSLKASMAPNSVIASDRARILPKPQLVEELKNFLGSNKGLTDSIMKLRKTKHFSMDDEKELKILSRELNTFLKVALSGNKETKCQNLKSPGFGFLRPIMNKTCDMGQLKIIDQVIRDFDCEHPTLKSLTDALEPLLKVGQKISPALAYTMTAPGVNNGTDFRNLLLPGCLDKKNRMPLENYRCDRYRPCTTNCEPLDQAKKKVRQLFLDGIDNNRSLQVGVCTAFMEISGTRTNFCKKKAKHVERHGFHSMAVTGYRCNQGIVEYEVLNSWGKDHCPKAAKDKNAEITCVKDNAGKNTGRFWVKEEALVDNIIDITEISGKTE